MLCVKDCPGREKSMCKGPKTGTEGPLWLQVEAEVERTTGNRQGPSHAVEFENFPKGKGKPPMVHGLLSGTQISQT